MFGISTDGVRGTIQRGLDRVLLPNFHLSPESHASELSGQPERLPSLPNICRNHDMNCE